MKDGKDLVFVTRDGNGNTGESSMDCHGGFFSFFFQEVWDVFFSQVLSC